LPPVSRPDVGTRHEHGEKKQKWKKAGALRLPPTGDSK